MSARRFILGDTTRLPVAEAIYSAPSGYVVTIAEPTRSLEQNARLHSIISEIAATRKWAGEYRDVETWKRLLTAAWMRATDRQVMLLPALDGHGVDAIYQRTSHLSVSELTELMDFIEAWMGNGGES